MSFSETITYFDISSYEHQSLFVKNHPVWNALKELSRYLSGLKLGKIEGDIHEGAYLIQPELISIGKGTVVEAGAYIKGPCFIGKHCQIRHGAYIRGEFVSGDYCVVGHTTEVKSTIFLNYVHASHFAYVGDSILGNRVNLGAGTKCANLRFDRSSIQVCDGSECLDTGMRKFGAILGDDAQTGCNSVTNPGTLMGKKSFLSPCSTAKGIILENQKIK